MSPYALYAVDLVAITVLTVGLYLPRHRRRELIVAFCGVNIGVLAVSAALAQNVVSAGLGLGLFGVLSIIRLRSTELSQTEVAYYFAALATGLLCGLGSTVPWLSVGGVVAILAVVALADSRLLMGRHRSQMIVVDRALPDESGLIAHLEQILGARVTQVTVRRLDMVNDSTTVDVTYEVPRRRAVRSTPAAHVSPARPVADSSAHAAQAPTPAPAPAPAPATHAVQATHAAQAARAAQAPAPVTHAVQATHAARAQSTPEPAWHAPAPANAAPRWRA